MHVCPCSFSALVASAILTALYLMQIVLLAYFPRQNRAISVRIPRRARQDPGVRMTGPLILLSAVSVAMGLWAGPLSQHIAGLFPG